MKKLLSVLIFILLLSESGFANNYECKHEQAHTKPEYFYVITDTKNNIVAYQWKMPLSTEFVETYKINKIEENIIYYDENKYHKKFILREDKDFPQTDGGTIFSYSKFDIGNNVEWVTHKCRKVKEINNVANLKKNKNKAISSAKQTCLKLGFKDESEKFANCTLKIIKIGNN
jgi:hypothetical protein